MPQVFRTPSAVRDLNAILDWISQDNLQAALDFVDEVDRLLILMAHHPLMGESVEYLHVGVRRQCYGDYLLFYRPRDNGIELLRVLHGARDIDNLFG